MGVLFESGNDLVWNPSPRLARMFVAQIRAMEDATGTTSGIGELVADEVEVDSTALYAFVVAIAEQMESTTNATVKTLFAGPFSIAAGILAACGRMPVLPDPGGRLARRGAALVTGHGQAGPIYEGLDEPVG